MSHFGRIAKIASFLSAKKEMSLKKSWKIYKITKKYKVSWIEMLPLVTYMAFNVRAVLANFWKRIIVYNACNIVCRSEFPFFILVLKWYRLILPFYTCILCFPLLCALVQKLKSYFLEIKHIFKLQNFFFIYSLFCVLAQIL